MLTNKQIKMLKLLDKRVEKCSLCELKGNGTVTPYWSDHAKYVIISEAPNRSEIRLERPFMGAGGNILRDELTNAGLRSSDFLIINSVQCVPNRRGNTTKPTIGQLNSCQGYIRKYIKIVNPEKIICLGNYAQYFFTESTQGVLRQRGTFMEWDIGGGYIFPVLFTVHPGFCVYEEQGTIMLRDDIIKFRDTKFERQTDWLFKEEEFLI